VTKDQIIILLLIVMGIVLTIELAYILLKKKRRKEEMALFRKPSEPTEPLSDKAHNTIVTTESISAALARQGIDTSQADGLIQQAKKELALKEYSTAIDRAEAAKLVLLRAKREAGAAHQDQFPPSADPDKRPMNKSLYDEPQNAGGKREEKSLDSLPTNYVQSKFMISTVGDLIDKKGITNGEAHTLYTAAVKFYDQGDYTRALSSAIKAERILDSGTLTLIGEEKPSNIAQEVVEEVLVCPGCEAEISEEDVFCRECGQNLAAAPECPGCSAEIAPSDRFCRKCGYKQA